MRGSFQLFTVLTAVFSPVDINIKSEINLIELDIIMWVDGPPNVLYVINAEYSQLRSVNLPLTAL